MKHCIKYPVMMKVVLFLAAVFTMSCSDREEIDRPAETKPVVIDLGADAVASRAFTDNHTVNRILILPFRKVNETLGDEDSNFEPDYVFARQLNVSVFPLENVTIYLPTKTSYKVAVIGYNQSDYDFNNRTNPANRFDIGSVSLPERLGNLHVQPKSASIVPEFFVCRCEAFDGGTSVGEVFQAGQSFLLKGNLTRLVSGISVTINNIPASATSVSLVAEQLVKASNMTDATPVLRQSAGDGESRLVAFQIPANGSVILQKYLLPTFDTYKTTFFLNIDHDGKPSETYPIRVPDSAVSVNNALIFNPNQAIDLSGDYTLIDFGFTLTFGINLDDNNWDGYH